MTKYKRRLPSEVLNSRPEIRETETAILKGLIGSIPAVGTLINEILFESANRVYQSRVNETVEILKEKISNIETTQVNREYLNSPDFFDYTNELFKNILKARSREKKEALSKMYIESFVKESQFETDTIRLFMNFVTELNLVQINILKFVKENQDELMGVASFLNFHGKYSSFQGAYKLSRFEFKYYSSDLESKSLLSFGAGLSDYFDTSKTLALEDHHDPSAILTELGREFITYLTN
ncbi:hypothetical protein [Aequorivita antarctica]|uniref:DUF4393 domain-containing protein n=1 Tax=Aequorivita antarctica TaxID=153266 RepID=A0A5C6Z0I3_9FLAO|nr:hypothetical protein [Aequorivita antarctica]TXD73537.1 hypothetical protein ESU54_07175 [Aequorivita antarctica]SRX76314.1 hypothetical protein AEQU3_03314 [Aequorivita antarctica]